MIITTNTFMRIVRQQNLQGTPKRPKRPGTEYAQDKAESKAEVKAEGKGDVASGGEEDAPQQDNPHQSHLSSFVGRAFETDPTRATLAWFGSHTNTTRKQICVDEKKTIRWRFEPVLSAAVALSH